MMVRSCIGRVLLTVVAAGSLCHARLPVNRPHGALIELPVDLSSLLDEAARFEQQVDEAVAHDAQLSGSVRELKKRQMAH